MNRFLIFPLYLLLLIGCDSFKKDSFYQNDFSNLKIDSAKISQDIIVADNLKINPPKNWVILNSSVGEKKFSIGMVTKRDENIIIKTKFILSGKAKNQIMTVSELIPDTNSAKNFLNNYYEFLKLKFRNDEISFANFTLNKKNVDLIQTKKIGLISLKFLLVLVNRKVYQIEFTFSNNDYKNLIEEIKSSVATIKY